MTTTYRKPWSKPGKGNRHQQGYGTAWDHIRLQVLKRDHYCCVICAEKGRVSIAREVDHRIPKARGGPTTMENLQSVCVRCHRVKTAAEMGRTFKPKPEIGIDGYPVEQDED